VIDRLNCKVMLPVPAKPGVSSRLPEFPIWSTATMTGPAYTLCAFPVYCPQYRYEIGNPD